MGRGQHSYDQESQLRSLRNYQIKYLLSKIQATVRSKVRDQLAIPQNCHKASVRTQETPISVQCYKLTRVSEIDVIGFEGSRINAEKKEKLEEEEEGQNLNINFPIESLTSVLAISSSHSDSDQSIGVGDVDKSQDEENYDSGRATALVFPSMVFPYHTVDSCSRFYVNLFPRLFVLFATAATMPFGVRLPYFNRCQCFDPGGQVTLSFPSTASSPTAFCSLLLQSLKSITMVDFPAMRSLHGPVSKVCEFNKRRSSVGIMAMLLIVSARQSHAYITFKVFDQMPRYVVSFTIECTFTRLGNVVVDLLNCMNEMNITHGKHTLLYCAVDIVDNNVAITTYSYFWVVEIYGFVSTVNNVSCISGFLGYNSYFKQIEMIAKGAHCINCWSLFSVGATIILQYFMISFQMATLILGNTRRTQHEDQKSAMGNLTKNGLACLNLSHSGFHYGIFVTYFIGFNHHILVVPVRSIDDFGTHETLVDNPSCTNNQTESKGILLKVELIIFAGTLSQGFTNMLLLFSHHHQVYQHELLIKGCDPDLVWNDTFISMLSLVSLGLWCYGSEVQSVEISYAKITNLPPTIGLNSSLVYPLLGNSTHLDIGLISIASLVMESMLREFIPYSQDLVLYLKLAFTATFFVGLFQSSQGNKICKITVIDEMPNGPNPLSSNMLYFNVHHLALAIKTGLVTRIWSLTEGIAIGRIVVADINNRMAVHAIRHLFPDGKGFFPSYFYDTFDEGQSVTDSMRSIYIFGSEKPFTIQQGIELFQHQLPKGSPLVLQHHEIVDVLHRKMIHKGNVQAAKVLIKWKALPPKHGTCGCSSLRTRMFERGSIVTE